VRVIPSGPQIYDLTPDRFEVVDRATDEPDTLARLLAELREVRASVAGDPLRPRANP
jgi:hypothetical protein